MPSSAAASSSFSPRPMRSSPTIASGATSDSPSRTGGSPSGSSHQLSPTSCWEMKPGPMQHYSPTDEMISPVSRSIHDLHTLRLGVRGSRGSSPIAAPTAPTGPTARGSPPLAARHSYVRKRNADERSYERLQPPAPRRCQEGTHRISAADMCPAEGEHPSIDVSCAIEDALAASGARPARVPPG